MGIEIETDDGVIKTDARIVPEGKYYYWEMFLGEGAETKFFFGRAPTLDEAVRDIEDKKRIEGRRMAKDSS